MMYQIPILNYSYIISLIFFGFLIYLWKKYQQGKQNKQKNSSLEYYLGICALEQRGNHCISFGHQDGKPMNLSILRFTQELIRLLGSNTDNYVEEKFLNNFSLENDSELFYWCIERDCQVLETGNHYVNLCLIKKISNLNYSINLYIRFQQSYSNMSLLKANPLNITFKYFVDNKVKSLRYNSLNISLIRQIDNILPNILNIPNNFKPQIKKNPDACIIC